MAKKTVIIQLPELPLCSCVGTPTWRIYDPGPTNNYRKWLECPRCGKRTESHLVDYPEDRPEKVIREWSKIALT